MNRDEIWQQLKNEKETIYGKKMMDVFLSVTEKLNIDHLEEAINSGYDVNDNAIKYNLNDILDTKPELLDKIISNKKDMSGKLMRYILDLAFSYGHENAKEIAKKMNLNKMTTDDVYSLAWIKVESIEQIYEIFGDKLKQFNLKQIINLIKEGVTWRIEGLLDKIVNSTGGWKSLVEKMVSAVNFTNGRLYTTQKSHVPLYDAALADSYQQLKINLNSGDLSEYFAKKIIENDKNAVELAKYFYPNIQIYINNTK